MFNAPNAERLEQLKAFIKPSGDNNNEHIDFNKLIPEPENKENWYSWRCAYWGTKWNAYDSYWSDDNTLCFYTAWSFCHQIVRQLSSAFPDITIDFIYADEDAGYNCGEGTFYNGDACELYFPEGGSDDAMEIYFKAYDCKDMWTKTNEGWRVIDD